MPEGVPEVTESASALPTLAQLRSRVYAPMRDSERSFIEPWFVDQLLNEGYHDLNARLRLYRNRATGTSASDGTVPFPADLVELVDLWFGDDKVEFQEENTFETYQQTSQPDPGIILGRTNFLSSAWVYETYPAQTSESYELNYIARPVAMVQDTDAPTHLTHELVPRIVNYARAHCKWQEGEVNEGALYMGMYEEGLPSRPRDQFRRRPQRFEIGVETGYFG